MIVDRRRLLGSAAALGAGAALPPLAWAQSPIAPPTASVRPVTETLHGVTVTDPYRWMETPSDPEWLPYLMGQNAYARAVLARIPGREDLAARIGHVSGEVAAVSAVQPASGMIFSEIRPAGANTFKLYVREGMHGADRLLFDPDTLATQGVHYSLDYWAASPDGSYVALGSSPSGSENSVLRFMHTATGKMLPKALDRAQSGAVAWTPDGDSNALRFQFMEAGLANIPEFGSIADAAGFQGLREMDALSHVKDGVKYPAVLLTTGVNDPRVAPWEPGKFTARLQAASASGKPVILRVETDAGHGFGSTRKQRDDETADTYAFILWQTGDPRFQPHAT